MKLRAVLRRRWPVLLLCVLLGGAAGALSGSLATGESAKVYTAKQVIVANSAQVTAGVPAQDQLNITRGQVPVEAAKTLASKEKPDDLAKLIEAKFDVKSNSITVSSNDEKPKVAAKRVDAFVQAFLTVTNNRLQAPERTQLERVTADLEAAQEELAKFDRDHPEVTATGTNAGPNNIGLTTLANTRQEIVNRITQITSDQRNRQLDLLDSLPYSTLGAETPRPADSGLVDVPSSAMARGILIAFLGLLLGAGVVMLVERVSRRIDTRDELAEITNLPILAEISNVPERRRAIDDAGRIALTGVWAEPYRRVRSAIQFVQVQQSDERDATPDHQPVAPRPATVLITSSSPGEGKSTTAALVSLALAEVGVPTVLIGGDFRKPQVDRLVGAQRSPSLQDLARLDIERPTVDEVVQQVGIDNLYVATAGDATREVSGLVQAARDLCFEAMARGATVIVDSSPLQAANDTLDLLPAVDHVIIVVRTGRSSESDLLDTVATLRRMEANILGVVLIGTPTARKQEYYYDYYSVREAES